MPILRFFFNPQIDTIFTQFAQINLQEQDYLNYLTTRLIKDLFTKKKFLQNKSINFFKNISYKRKLYFYRVKTKENGGKLKEIQFYQGFGKAYFALHFIDKMSADGAFGCAFCKQNARQRKLNLRQTKTIISKKKNSSFSWVHFAQQNAPIVHSTHAPRGRLRQSRHGDTNNYHSGCAFCFAKCNTVVQNPHDACAFCKAKCKTIATSYASQEGVAVCYANCLHRSKINCAERHGSFGRLCRRHDAEHFASKMLTLFLALQKYIFAYILLNIFASNTFLQRRSIGAFCKAKCTATIKRKPSKNKTK